jgi:hypothetical protein
MDTRHLQDTCKLSVFSAQLLNTQSRISQAFHVLDVILGYVFTGIPLALIFFQLKNISLVPEILAAPRKCLVSCH